MRLEYFLLFDRIVDLKLDERAIRTEATVPESSTIFEGHFPGTPILPGVTQLDWAILLGRELFPIPPDFLRMEVIKFQQVISPGTTLTFELTWNAERGVLSYKITSVSGSHASGRIAFGKVSR